MTSCGKRLDVDPPQRRDVPASTERCGDVLGQYPDVGALGTQRLQLEHYRRKVEQRQFEQLDLARGARHADADACKLVQRLAVALDAPNTSAAPVAAPRESAAALERCPVRSARAPDHGAVTSPSASPVLVRGTERDGEAVALAPGEDVAGDLRRFAQADRQHAGGQRIEAADVAGLLAPEERRTRCRAAFDDRPSGLSSSSTPLGTEGRPSAAALRSRRPRPPLRPRQRARPPGRPRRPRR